MTKIKVKSPNSKPGDIPWSEVFLRAHYAWAQAESWDTLFGLCFFIRCQNDVFDDQKDRMKNYIADLIGGGFVESWLGDRNLHLDAQDMRKYRSEWAYRLHLQFKAAGL